MPNEIGTSFEVFSLLAQHGINVDIILQGIGHAEGKDICFYRGGAGPGAGGAALRGEQGASASAGWRPTRMWPRYPWWARASSKSRRGGPAVRGALRRGININMFPPVKLKYPCWWTAGTPKKAVQVIHDKFLAMRT